MDKSAILAQIVQHLSDEIAHAAEASRSARAAATHDDARAEDQYDTRATEASYLANGQAKLAAELQESLELYRKLHVRDFAADEPIAVTALVEVDRPRGNVRDFYFLGPRAGGITVEIEGREVFVITPQSPLGRKILGRTAGTAIPLETGRTVHILAVS